MFVGREYSKMAASAIVVGLTLAILSGGAATTQAAVIFIDGFDIGQELAQTGGGAFGPISSSISDASIVGGDRTMTLEGLAFNSVQTVKFASGGGEAVLETGTMSFGDGSLEYDGDLSSLAGAADYSVNFNGLQLGGAANIRVSATISDGSNSATKFVDINSNQNDPFSVDFNFGGSGVDLNNLTSVKVDFVTTVGGSSNNGGADFSLDSITAVTASVVPEPTTLAAWSLLGAVGLLLHRRRAKNGARL